MFRKRGRGTAGISIPAPGGSATRRTGRCSNGGSPMVRSALKKWVVSSERGGS